MDRRVVKLEQSVAVVRGPDYRSGQSVPSTPECYAVVQCDRHGNCQSSTVCVEGNSWFGDSSEESGDDSWFGGGGVDGVARTRRAKRVPSKLVAVPPSRHHAPFSVAAPSSVAAPKPSKPTAPDTPTPAAPDTPTPTAPDTPTAPKRERKDRKKEPSPDKESRRTRKSAAEALQQEIDNKARIQ
jgi:hypothetical protein